MPATRWATIRPVKAASERATELGRYQLDFYDGFDAAQLDARRWIPHYLPQWSSQAASRPRYGISNGRLILRIDPDQRPWCPEFNGPVRVSSLQTGLFAGPLGSPIGQHRFSQRCVVREEQAETRLYTPRFGSIEMRARCEISPGNVAALWMIGFEDAPERSAEICIFELKGENVQPKRSVIGYGLHPFGDPAIRDAFFEDDFDLDVRVFNTYAVEWMADQTRFFVNHRLVRVIGQSPQYEMQLMLNLYELNGADADEMRFEVDYVAGYRPLGAV
jgi:hypothetical protein